MNKPVMSLRTGGPVGVVTNLIVNPSNLKIEGWYVEGQGLSGKKVLLSQDIRDILPQGFVVDDKDVLSDVSDLIRLKSVIDLGFALLGKVVDSDSKRRIGKVSDFAFEKDVFFIQKLYINQSLIRSISGGGAIIDRTQIVEINNKRIVVREATVPGKVESIVAGQPAA